MDLKLDKEINILCSKLHNRIYNIKKISQYTDFKTRLSFLNSFVIGKLNYMLPLYLHAPEALINKLHKATMTAARCAIENFCFKKSCCYILKKCNWLNIKNMILYAGINFTYNILSKKQPKSMLKLYKDKCNNRVATKWYTIYVPKTETTKKFHIYKCLQIFYQLPKEIQNCKSTVFKKKLKAYLSTNTVLFNTDD